MARRLLRRAVGLVYNSALYGFVIWCIGCVIPTPLDRAPAPTNYSPVWVTTRVQPPFGSATESTTSAIALSLAATDPNPDDVLTVRLYEPSSTSPTGYIFTGFETTLMSAPDPDDPNLRIGSMDPGLCLNAQPLQKFQVFAAVADRPFNGMTPNAPSADGGLLDMNHWELTCD